MKLLLDQGIPFKSAALFRSLGYSCSHVAELGMEAAEDDEILAKAAADGCVVVTLDADFHTLVAVRRLRGPSVIRLRREGYRADRVVELMKDVLLRHRSSLVKGCLISVTEQRAKVRMLRIVPV